MSCACRNKDASATYDGGQNDAFSRLSEMINRADAAVCTTDCVSHATYYRLKRLCKRNGKPCLLFKGNAISSFASVPTQISSSQANLRSDVIEQSRGNVYKLLISK